MWIYRQSLRNRRCGALQASAQSGPCSTGSANNASSVHLASSREQAHSLGTTFALDPSMTGTAQPPVRMHMLLAATIALVVAQLGRSSAVQASCVGADLVVLWSYPETGAEQVPTDLTIWAVTNSWSARPVATLDGSPVEMQGAPTFSGVYFQPQNLAPNSDHTLVLDYSRSPNLAMPGEPLRFEIEFKTGAGPAAGAIAEPAVPSSARQVTDFAAHDCADVIAAQDCFDTGQDALLSLNVEENQPDDTVGWLLQTRYLGSSVIWPARCGAPSVYLHRQESLCFEVQRIGAGGKLSQAVEHCSEPTADMPAAGHGGTAASDAGRADAEVDAGAADASPVSASEAAPASADAPAGSAGCSTVSGARTAARAFWAIVVIALLLAHSQRHRRRRPRGVTPSRRFRM